jgi:hypothetical protein
MTGGTFVDIDCLSLTGAVFLGALGLLLAVPVAATIKSSSRIITTKSPGAAESEMNPRRGSAIESQQKRR